MPSMVSLDRAMADKPFQMLTIVFNDDHKMADSFARQFGATFPVLSNPSPELNEAYMITGVPETFIIDADVFCFINSSAPITGIHGRREI